MINEEDKKEAALAQARHAYSKIDWQLEKEQCEFMACFSKTRYDAYVKAGFSDSQALYLLVNGVKNGS